MPRKGYKPTPEHREKLRENAKNGKGTKKTKRIDYDLHSQRAKDRWTGELNPNWKGGVSREKRYKHYYNAEYKKWRISVFTRDNFTCQSCGIRGVYITAHHIKSWAKYKELRYDINNGVTLCEECHKLTDNYKGRKQ